MMELSKREGGMLKKNRIKTRMKTEQVLGIVLLVNEVVFALSQASFFFWLQVKRGLGRIMKTELLSFRNTRKVSNNFY